MDPIGYGMIRLAMNAVATGVLAGLIGGLVVWWARMRLVWGALLAFALFMALICVNGLVRPWLGLEVTMGVPPLIMTFAIYMLVACGFARIMKIRRAWIALTALALSLGIGVAYLLLFNVELSIPGNVAVVADVVLLLGAIATWFRRLRFRPAQ